MGDNIPDKSAAPVVRSHIFYWP